jgi:cytochrome c oxidase assembly factor CtaG
MACSPASRRWLSAASLAALLLVGGAGAAWAGPPPGSTVPTPTLSRLLLDWSLNPTVLIGLLAAAVLYLQGRRRLVANGIHWPRRRTGYFLAALGTLAFALLSPLEAYDTVLFSVHVTQHMLLTMVAGPLLALGAPVTLALRATRGTARRRLVRVLNSRLVHVVGNPLVAWVLFTLSLYALYFSSLFDLTLRQPLVHDLVHLHFIGVGMLFWWPLVGVDPSRWRLHHMARLLLVFLMVPFHAFLGVAIMNSGRLLAPSLATFVRHWGPTPLDDQRAGGAILWGAGDLIALAAILGILVAWASYEEKVVAAREDRQVARDRAARAARTPPAAPPSQPSTPPPTPPGGP